MSTVMGLGPVSVYVRQRLSELLDTRRVVVWYDPERVFADLVHRLNLDHCVLVSDMDSRLQARRAAELHYRRLNESDGSPEANHNLLIYLSAPRGATSEEQQQDPFEAFARCGAPFGDQEGQRLQALAQNALPQREQEIARLFREGQPTLALLDDLRSGTQYPLVRKALGTDAPVEALTVALSRSDAGEKLGQVPGALPELQRLAQTELGLSLHTGEAWAPWKVRLARFILVSERAFDLPAGLPAQLGTVSHADEAARERVYALCDQLRETDAGREAYVQLARETQTDLHLSSALGAFASLGTRDTFPVQEQARLRAVVEAVAKGDVPAARQLATGSTNTIWMREPERSLLWRVAEHCLTFLETSAIFETQSLPTSVRSLVDVYSADNGLWQLDQAQRRFEHAAAQCAQDDEVEQLIQICRTRYATAVQRVQAAFQQAAQQEGWPPDGVRRQTQTFDTAVAPELTARRKIAYFLVDSLRYEMGRELAAALADLGAAQVQAAASILPTITPYGMAALLPGADGAFTLVEHHGKLESAIGGTPLPTVNERKELLASKYGDRYTDLTLEELLGTAPKHLKKRLAQTELAVIRTQDIDAAGEGHSLYRARQVMPQVLAELRTAALRLADSGFHVLVFAADHGHILLPELPAGDALAEPPGKWLLTTRRSLLGHIQAQPPGMLVIPAQHMGIVAPVEEYVTASGFKTLKAGEGYFHEGLSLQECIIPVVTLRLAAQTPVPEQGDVQVEITYRSDRFTSSLINLKLRLSALFIPELAVNVAAYASTNPKAAQVGSAGECDAQNPLTKEIMLRAGADISVPLLLDPEYTGESIDVRATDPKTGAILHRLTLKNARLD